MIFDKYENVGLKNCIEALRRAVKLSDKEIRFCFGMSKMTVRDEVANREEYDRLRIVEFYEFLGRCAHIKYSSDTESHLG